MKLLYGTHDTTYRLLQTHYDFTEIASYDNIDSTLYVESGTVRVPLSYQNSFKANYLSFQIDSYTIYALLTGRKGVTPFSTELTYVIDSFVTAVNNSLTINSAFVIRDNKNDYSNISEVPVTPSRYICSEVVSYNAINDGITKLLICKGTYPENVIEAGLESTMETETYQFGKTQFVGKIYKDSEIENALEMFAKYGALDRVLTYVSVPTAFLNWNSNTIVDKTTLTLNKSTSLNNYVPANSNCLKYPYYYFELSDNKGTVIEINPSNLSSDDCQIGIRGNCNIDDTIFAFVKNHNGRLQDYDKAVSTNANIYLSFQNGGINRTDFLKGALTGVTEVGGIVAGTNAFIASSAVALAMNPMAIAAGAAVASGVAVGSAIIPALSKQSTYNNTTNTNNVNFGIETFTLKRMEVISDIAQQLDNFYNENGCLRNKRVSNLTILSGYYAILTDVKFSTIPIFSHSNLNDIKNILENQGGVRWI